MTLKNTAVFAQTPQTAQAVVSNAITLTGVTSLASDDCANTQPLLTAGIDGALVTRITLLPRGTITACNAYLFVRRASDPSQIRRLIDTVAVPARTASTTVPPSVQSFSIAINESAPLRLGAGDELHVGISVAQAVGIGFNAELTQF